MYFFYLFLSTNLNFYNLVQKKKKIHLSKANTEIVKYKNILAVIYGNDDEKMQNEIRLKTEKHLEKVDSLNNELNNLYIFSSIKDLINNDSTKAIKTFTKASKNRSPKVGGRRN